MRTLSILLLLTGCPKTQPKPLAGEGFVLLTAEEVLAPKVGVERLRGLWWLQLTPDETAYMRACHVALTSPEALPAALKSLDPDTQERARQWVGSGSRGRHLLPAFRAPGHVVLVVRDGVFMMRVQGYVFDEVPYRATEVNADNFIVHKLFNDGTEIPLTATFDGDDKLQISDDLGAWMWMVGHDGPLHFVRDP
jgi:hypothetical protein